MEEQLESVPHILPVDNLTVETKESTNNEAQAPNTSTTTTDSVDTHTQLSKSALKKLKKKERWEEKKKLKRFYEKQKKKDLPPEIIKMKKEARKRKKYCKKMKDSDCKVHIIVDLSFDGIMNEKDNGRCANQINRCYSHNRALPNPAQFHVTSFSPDRPTGRAMKKIDGYANWDVVFHEKPFYEVYDKSKLVYLSSESKTVLQTLEDDKVYIIGGLVDHNSKKGLCHQIAIDKGIAHARLPLSEYIDMKTRCVLSINQVFAIVSNVAQGMDWQAAILEAVPQRKMATPKDLDKQLEDEDEIEGSKNDDSSSNCDMNQEIKEES